MQQKWKIIVLMIHFKKEIISVSFMYAANRRCSYIHSHSFIIHILYRILYYLRLQRKSPELDLITIVCNLQGNSHFNAQYFTRGLPDTLPLFCFRRLVSQYSCLEHRFQNFYLLERSRGQTITNIIKMETVELGQYAI